MFRHKTPVVVVLRKKHKSIISVQPFACSYSIATSASLSDWHFHQISQFENIFGSGSRVSRWRGASPIFMINFLKKAFEILFRPPLPLH